MQKLDAKARRLLAEPNFAFLGTINRDGTPHVTPVWVDTDGQHVLVNTAMGRVKHRNVERDPRVAISLVDREHPYNRVSLRGRVVASVTGKDADDQIDKLAKKYTGAAKYKKSNPNEKRITFRIRVDKIFDLVT